MRLPRPKLGLNPITLSDRVIFAIRIVGGCYPAQNIGQKWTDRVQLELGNRLKFRLTSLEGGYGIRVSPDVFLE
jgi:hypothetical protein